MRISVKSDIVHVTFLVGKEPIDFKLQFAGDIDVAHKAVALGLFDFRSFLNIGMLLTTSEKARQRVQRLATI